MNDIELSFVKPFNDTVNYRIDQEELINKALEISNGDNLIALNYIVTCLQHNNIKDVEFELVFTIPPKTKAFITLPIIESEPKDELGYYVSWGDNDITHNISSHIYGFSRHAKEYKVSFFGLGITGFGLMQYGDYNKYLTKVISFGKLGHCHTSLSNAFYRCKNNFSIPTNLPSNITDLSNTFNFCQKFNQKIEWNTSNITTMESMLSQCENFDQDLKLDLTNTTTLEHMFSDVLFLSHF
jgi:hypothetical protein